MVNTCFATYCKTGYKRKRQVAEYHSVFRFPDKKPSLKEKWIHFVNRKHWTPTKNSGIWAKHLEEKYLRYTNADLKISLFCIFNPKNSWVILP